MIRVDVINNEISLSNLKPNLAPHHFAQIRHWNFREHGSDSEPCFNASYDPRRLINVLDFLDYEKISYEFSPNCEQVVESIRNKAASFEDIKSEARKFKDNKRESSEYKNFKSSIRKCVVRPLKDHQIRSAFHLALVGNGANFSVPGSGKTSVVLSVYEMLRRQKNVNLLLVVGPPSCFSPWKKEFELTLGRKPAYKVLAGGDKQNRKSSYYAPAGLIPELCLSTYQTLLNDQTEISFMLSQRGVKAFMVIDEAHYVKRLQGTWAKAVLGIANLVQFRCVLTGTPMPRSYTDLYNLFDFLWLNNSPIDENSKIDIQMFERDGNDKGAIDSLKDKIGPFFYRVPKSELGLSKPLFHPPLVIKMHQYERKIYDAIIHKIRSYSTQDYLRNIDIVTRLRRGRMIRIRQCLSYAGLLGSVLNDYNEDLVTGDSDLARLISEYDQHEIPAKILALKNLVKSLSGCKAKLLIWTNFIGTIKLIQSTLIKDGYECKSIYGAIPVESVGMADEETRESIIAEFLDSESGVNILVANPAACAESISLHKSCQHAIYYDLSYNCAQYLQSLDRIHRVGGSETKEAHYYFLQYFDTIDSDIKKNLDIKKNKMLSIIENDLEICSLDMGDDTGDDEAYFRLFKAEP